MFGPSNPNLEFRYQLNFLFFLNLQYHLAQIVLMEHIPDSLYLFVFHQITVFDFDVDLDILVQIYFVFEC